jgi:hypothetical protein
MPSSKRVTIDSIRNHTNRHFPVQNVARATYREVLERRAKQNSVDFIDGVATAITPLAVLETVMVKGYQTLVDELTTADGAQQAAREFGTAGAMARRERRLRLAEALWRQSLRRDVTNIRSSSSLGQLLHHQGRYAEAVDLLVPVADVDSYAHLFLGWSRLQLGLTEGDQDVAKQGLADVAAELKRWSLNASRTDRTPWLRNVRRLYLLGPDFRKEVDQLISFANSNANWPKVSAEEVKDVAKLEEDDVEPLAGLASTPADLLGPEAKK